MMQIYATAICNSRKENTQYVLQKGLNMERTSKEERVLTLLKEGWDITGKFINGAGYESYKIDNSTNIELLKNFLKSSFDYDPSTFKDVVTLSFQEFYNNVCESEGVNVDIIFFDTANSQHEKMRFEGDKAESIRSFLRSQLFVKQDKNSLIQLLEQKNRKYYEVEFGKKKELEDDSFVGTPDRYSICIIAEHYPTFEEAEEFCKSDMEKWGYDTVCDVLEISYEEAHNFFDMENEDKFPILK